MTPRPIILDCDPGIDDAIAILLALASPEEIDLRAITCVVGNVPLEKTALNARRVAALAGGAAPPIYAGCPRPLMRPFVREATVHGNDGLGGVAFPPPACPQSAGHAVDAIVEGLMQSPAGSLTLCPIGPMTNLALAMVKEPATIPRIREVVFMGGAAFGPGNVTPVAEFNIHADPQAAQIVLSSGAPLVMFGLDVTHQAVAKAARVEALREAGGQVCQTAAALLTAYGREEGFLHDPCVIAYLMRPSLFGGQAGHLAVDCDAGPNLGRTVCASGKEAPNATVITEIDADGFFALLTERLARYG